MAATAHTARSLATKTSRQGMPALLEKVFSPKTYGCLFMNKYIEVCCDSCPMQTGFKCQGTPSGAESQLSFWGETTHLKADHPTPQQEMPTFCLVAMSIEQGRPSSLLCLGIWWASEPQLAQIYAPWVFSNFQEPHGLYVCSLWDVTKWILPTPPSPSLYVKGLTSNMIVFGDRAFKEIINVRGWHKDRALVQSS